MSAGAATRPIDPLCAMVDGRYADDLVVVQPIATSWPPRGRDSVRTAHFDIVRLDGRLVVTHSVSRSAVSDDLAGLIVDELFVPGWVRGSEMFERIFTGVVRSTEQDPLRSWELFYRNTIQRLDTLFAQRTGGSSAAGHGTIEGYAPVYAHAESLTGPGSALELGCCFGFLSLRLARSGRRVTASDVSAGTVRLLSAVAPRLGADLTTVRADAARVSLPDAYAETVLVVHLLEHLDEEHGARVVAEALRLAGQRVVVAVPLETEADESYGHVRTVSLDDLTALGSSTGLHVDVHEHHGGWLVLERAASGRRDLQARRGDV